MNKVILTKGLPASGKTTWAKKMLDENPEQFKRINKDDLRAMLDNKFFSRKNEKFVLKIRDTIINEALNEGFNVIVDDTNINPKHHNHISQLVSGRAEVEVAEFNSEAVEDLIERDKQRENPVGSKVIRRMYGYMLGVEEGDKVQKVEGLPSAVMCDLDGTLAKIKGRSPYDASTCETDQVNEPVRAILFNYWKCTGNPIILVSGRDEKYVVQTMNWLRDHDIPYDLLYMRGVGDNRRDSIVKREIFDRNIRGKFNIDFVMDDRDQVVDLWRGLGLTCLQVDYGDF